MRRVRFGRTGVEVPAVSLGTWGHGGPKVSGSESVGWSGNDDAAARESLLAAHRLGINHWDTADVYGDGHAESIIGSIWSEVPRDSVFLATKIGWDAGTYEHAYDPRHIRERFERSLELLSTDYVDLYYMHRSDFGKDDEYLEGAVEAFRSLRAEGRIRFIGLSDWDSTAIMRVIDTVEPDVVQPYRNVVDDDYVASGLRDWVDGHDAGVAFFSPIKHGLLLGKYEEPVEFPEGDYRRNVHGFGDRETIDRMKRARTQVQSMFPQSPEPVLHALIGALLSDAPTGCVLLGQRSPRHVAAAAQIGEALSPDMAETIRRLYRAG